MTMYGEPAERNGVNTRHMHLLVRYESGEIGGAGQHLTADDVRNTLNGTPYRDDLNLWGVVQGRTDRAYCVNLFSWVAVTTCGGTTAEECVQVMQSTVIGGDIRLKKHLEGLL